MVFPVWPSATELDKGRVSFHASPLLPMAWVHPDMDRMEPKLLKDGVYTNGPIYSSQRNTASEADSLQKELNYDLFILDFI